MLNFSFNEGYLPPSWKAADIVPIPKRMGTEAVLFLIFWRFQPQVVLKLFLFPDTSKQSISCPKQEKEAKKYMFAIVSSSDMRKKMKPCQYSVREFQELPYYSSSAR